MGQVDSGSVGLPRFCEERASRTGSWMTRHPKRVPEQPGVRELAEIHGFGKPANKGRAAILVPVGTVDLKGNAMPSLRTKSITQSH